MKVVDPCRYVDRVREVAKIPGHGHDQGVEWAARSFLAELASSETEDVSCYAEAAHVLVTSA
jgi:hypothetical protein